MTNKEFMETIRILESKEIVQLKNQNNAMKKDYEKKISEQAQTIKNITNELEKLKQQMNENKNEQEMIDN